MSFSTLRTSPIHTRLSSPEEQSRRTRFNTVLLVIILLLDAGELDDTYRRVTNTIASTIRRTRYHVYEIFDQLGPHRTKKAYRMDRDCFNFILRTLAPYIKEAAKKKRNPDRVYLRAERSNVGARNGLIAPSTRLAIGIRFWGGGAHVDLAPLLGISDAASYDCVEILTDAIHSCPLLDFKFPRNEEELSTTAKQFQRRSSAGFSKCVGTLDGILIWMEAPTKKDAEFLSCGPAKFFCGRKKNTVSTCKLYATPSVALHTSRFFIRDPPVTILLG